MKFPWNRTKAAASSRKRTGESGTKQNDPLFSGPRVITTAGLLAFAAAVIAVGFVGYNPTGPYVARDQVARIRITTDRTFTYESEILTEQKKKEVRQRVPPVYRLDFSPFHNFESYIQELNSAMIEHLEQPRLLGSGPQQPLTSLEVRGFLAKFDPKNTYNLNPDDLAIFYNSATEEIRTEALAEGLRLLNGLFRQGIYDEEMGGDEMTPSGMDLSALQMIRIIGEQGTMESPSMLSYTKALRELRANLAVLPIPSRSSSALSNILRHGLKPNLKYDQVRTEQAAELAAAEVEPVRVTVREGDTIIEPNALVTALVEEKLLAYRNELQRDSQRGSGITPLLLEQSLSVLAILLVTVFGLRLRKSDIRSQWRTLGLVMLTILFNLLITRLILELGASPLVRTSPLLIATLTWLIPMALAPLTVAMLAGNGPGLVTAALTAILTALMNGNSMGVLILGFLSGVTAIYSAQGTQARAKVVRAGIISGIPVAVGAMALGLRDSLDFSVVATQMLVAMLTGLATGIVVIGFLPALENIFKFTTNITMLELTDFNHPLLRRMQMEAPGSYHHSLMVGNLAENAAASIGANGLLCRACAYFHDIGKLVKPEYFTENQRDGYNPHLECNPSMSALIIKAHVKEGVALAREYRLPKPVVDIIKEHHGTSLIQYFYYKALEQRKKTTPPLFDKAPKIDLSDVNESTYRYEGPRPHFKESAIIHLADAVEAAGRSLKKVTAQSVEDLVSSIVASRLSDGQLDNAPLTFRELTAIKASFVRTLLSSLHSRVEYPNAAVTERPRREDASSSTPPFIPATLGTSDNEQGKSATTPPIPVASKSAES